MESELIIKDIFEDMAIPPEFICPLTYKIMVEPVIAEDGYTYEKEAFINLTDSLSPVTKEPINKSIMIPNNALSECIIRYKYELNVNKIKELNDINTSNTLVINKELKQKPETQETIQNKEDSLYYEDEQARIKRQIKKYT